VPEPKADVAPAPISKADVALQKQTEQQAAEYARTFEENMSLKVDLDKAKAQLSVLKVGTPAHFHVYVHSMAAS
jgi:hypothetical protein